MHLEEGRMFKLINDGIVREIKAKIGNVEVKMSKDNT